MADDLFGEAVRRTGFTVPEQPPIEAGVLALAIDPLLAPALLTVASLEYQLGRVDTALAMFVNLTSLPRDEPDLVEIVDRAGSFLLEQGNAAGALRLFQAANDAYPGEATYWNGLGYCLARFGRIEDAVAAQRRAVALEPGNSPHLNDLGWALMEAGAYAEARSVLQEAVTRAPAGYELPRKNLEELESRQRSQQPM